MTRFPVIAVLAVLAACNDPGVDSFGDDVADVQVPPRGHADVFAWLEAGHYLAWSCEPEPHPRRPGSGHGPNRICSNTALQTAGGDGPYPVGAAAVKEIFDDAGQLRQYAVYRKMTAGTGGDSWYWYEGFGDDVVANAEGDDTCTGCHGRAPRDFVYTVVPAASN
ncbi:MAG: hypothetical protein M3680_18805 [Myxococcota bacterium]|nr:hypothetical protein [Myxococcota bacterium]